MSGHVWLWGILVYVDDREADAISRGERRTLRKVDPYDRSRVQGAAVFCERCQRPFVEAVGEPCFDGRGSRESTLVLPPGVR
jgi:hypothetical protein